jgi:hypothetical protein
LPSRLIAAPDPQTLPIHLQTARWGRSSGHRTFDSGRVTDTEYAGDAALHEVRRAGQRPPGTRKIFGEQLEAGLHEHLFRQGTRTSSAKRVASAVGEGSIGVQMVRRTLQEM